MIAGLRVWRDAPSSDGAVLCRSVDARRLVGRGATCAARRGRLRVRGPPERVRRRDRRAAHRQHRGAADRQRRARHRARRSCDARAAPGARRSRPPGRCGAARRLARPRRRLGVVRRPPARASRSPVARVRRSPSSAQSPVSTACRSSLHGTGGAWMVVAADADPGDVVDAGRPALARPQGVQHAQRVLRRRASAAADSCRSWSPAPRRLPRHGRTAPVLHATRERVAVPRRRARPLDEDDLGTEWEWDDAPELSLVVVDDVDEAVQLFNRHSPRFAASLVGGDRRAARARSTTPSTPRSSATASRAGSTGSSRSISPSSACRTGRPAGCSRAAACCRATRCSPCARGATSPTTTLAPLTSDVRRRATRRYGWRVRRRVGARVGVLVARCARRVVHQRQRCRVGASRSDRHGRRGGGRTLHAGGDGSGRHVGTRADAARHEPTPRPEPAPTGRRPPPPPTDPADTATAGTTEPEDTPATPTDDPTGRAGRHRRRRRRPAVPRPRQPGHRRRALRHRDPPTTRRPTRSPATVTLTLAPDRGPRRVHARLGRPRRVERDRRRRRRPSSSRTTPSCGSRRPTPLTAGRGRRRRRRVHRDAGLRERRSAGLPNGWFHTDDGSYVLNEPDGARTWLPSNDHPSDKATWTVPRSPSRPASPPSPTAASCR